jgi:predicted enzyme related to lactoylglutathione lyase
VFVGFQELVISVEDTARLTRIFTDVMKWRAEPVADAPPEQFTAWHVPPGCTRIEQVLLRPTAESKGFVRLVRFHGAAQVHMRSSGRTWDTGGIFDFDAYVKDARTFYRDLQRHGCTAYGDPTDYEWGGFKVCEAVVQGPDGLCIGLLQPYGKVLIDLPDYGAGMSRAFNSAQTVRDYDVSMAFYIQKLGWKVLVDTEVKDAVEPGQQVLGIPMPLAKTVRRRVSIIHPEGTNDGSVELIAMEEIAGVDFADRCVAPNIGNLTLRFPVADARAYATEVKARGVDLYTAPMTLEIAPYGKVTLFSVRTPDGAILEFYSA